MKSDLSKVKVDDKIWTIEAGWEQVLSIDYAEQYPIETKNCCYTINGKRHSEEFASAFLEYPFKEQSIEKDTLVWFKDCEDAFWKVGYYSHFENGKHYIFNSSKKSTEINDTTYWEIVTTENPLT